MSYTPGAVALQISSAAFSKENKKASALFSKDFSLKRKPVTENDEEIKTKKKKKPQLKAELASPEQDKAKDKKEKPKTRPPKRKKDPELDKRTVFVGNISCEAAKKDVLKLFKPHGAIESIRFRSATPSNPKLPKRAAVITKEFHDSMSSMNAYIVFKEEKSAQSALSVNSQKLLKFHLRVDSLHPKNKKHDDKHSVFLGNLPLEVKEEDVRLHFSDCGEIRNVRLVRDKGTGIGKGFGFVLFKDKCGVDLALKMHEEDFNGRKLRVMASGTDKKKKTKKGADKDGKTSNFQMRYEKKAKKMSKEGGEKNENEKMKEGMTHKQRKLRNKKKSRMRRKTQQKKKVAAILTGTKKSK